MSTATLRPCLRFENASIEFDIERNDEDGEWEQGESEIEINKIASFPRSFWPYAYLYVCSTVRNAHNTIFSFTHRTMGRKQKRKYTQFYCEYRCSFSAIVVFI